MSDQSRERASLADRPLRHSSTDEAALLAREREFVVGDLATPSTGLAFSGGGIRSGAFAIGVTQALVADGRLGDFHYLSTVSGGGYAGTALTWWLHQGLPTETGSVPAGTAPENFPFGSRSRNGTTAQAQNALLDFLRQHASYLQPTNQLGLLSAVAVVMRSSLLSLIVYFTLLVGGLGLTLTLGAFRHVPGYLFGAQPWLANYISNWFLFSSTLLFGLLGMLAFGYALSTRFVRGTRSYSFRTSVQRHIGRMLSVSLWLLSVGLLPLFYFALDAFFRTDPLDPSGAIAFGALSTALGSYLGASEVRQRALGRVSGYLTRIKPPAALALLSYGMFVSALAVADRLSGYGFELGGFSLVLLLGLLAGYTCNINYLGVHRMYRDRLMELFTPSPSAVRSGAWQPATLADGTAIHQVCGASEERCRHPYHLINTNVVLVDSRRSDYRGRGGDSFILSPLYCGSRATGWIRSDRYMNATGGRGMSLPSAMAISGAAVNPNTGVAGRGLTRTKLGSIALSLLNLRLGYFAPNPAKERSRIPNFLQPGITAGVLGVGLNETAPLVELTDGGHFENLGIYELLRRRVSFIVATDAGEDGMFGFGDLANAVERARVDFGIKISFDSECGLDGVAPMQGGEGRLRLANRSFAIAKIDYPCTGSGDLQQASVGTLVYIKSTLMSGLPADVLGYCMEHAAFPHESTNDQFFDERQFEAYRELGYHAGWSYLEFERSRQRSQSGIATSPGAVSASIDSDAETSETYAYVK